MSTQQFSDADRLGCEGCPDSYKNRESLQQRGVVKTEVNPVLDAIEKAVWSYRYGVDLGEGGYVSDRHNVVIRQLRSAYLRHHPQGPEAAGRTTSYYICPQCKTPIDMTGTGLDGLPAPSDGGKFELELRRERAKTDNMYFHSAIGNLEKAHNADRSADKQRIAEIEELLAAAKKPRVMKRWGVDGVPTTQGYYYIATSSRYEGTVMLKLPQYVTEKTINSGKYSGRNITHYLELEPTPTLPESSDDMIAGDGD